jgi:hypothetical protein
MSVSLCSMNRVSAIAAQHEAGEACAMLINVSFL